MAANAQMEQPAAAATPTFEIKRFDLVGNTLLSDADVQRILAPYVGPQRTLADVQRAQAAIDDAYRDRGYAVVQVALPEQNITGGIIQFRVLQPKVGKVFIEGNKYFNNDNVRASLPSIREGQVPNSAEVARNLQMTSEHPTKRTTVLLRTAEDPQTVDVNVKVDEDRPWRFVASLDNTGTSDTGYWRAGLGFQATNLFNRDQTASFQYITSPTNPSKVSIFGGGWHAPVYALNSSFDVYAGYSDVNSGVVQGLFNVSGKGTIFGARWNYYLPKFGALDQKLSLGVDYRAFRNDVTLNGVGLVPDVTVHPASVGYQGIYRDANSELVFNGSVAANISGGNDGTPAAFAATRASATSNYVLYRASVTYQRTFGGDWQGRINAQGQYTPDALVPGEQFGLGGPDSVRGYLVRELSNDRGASSQFELYTPELNSLFKLSGDYRMRLLGFYDFGVLARNKALPAEITNSRLSDAGIGIRLNYSKSVSFRFDWAYILQDGGTRQQGDQRFSAGMALVF